MKINFAMYNLRPSGGNRVILEVANRLARRGHQVTLTIPIHDSYGSMWPVEVEVKKPPPGRYVEASRLLDYLLRGGFLAARKLGYGRAFESDLIKKLAATIPNCDFNFATLFPTAFSVHRSGKGIPFYYVQCYEPGFNEDTYLRKMAEESYLLPMNFVAVSSWLQKTLRDKYSKEAHLCFNGVDRDLFHPRKKASSHSKTIMCIGRSAKWKGLPDLIKAMNIVYREIRDVELVVATFDLVQLEGAQFPYRVISCPSDESLAQQYSASDVFVSPSTLEGFPLPPLEAMACGTAVVTTSIGTEDYAINEVNSLVVPPGQPDELAKAILRFVRDDELRDDLGSEALKTAEKFSWDQTTSRIEDILRGFQ